MSNIVQPYLTSTEDIGPVCIVLARGHWNLSHRKGIERSKCEIWKLEVILPPTHWGGWKITFVLGRCSGCILCWLRDRIIKLCGSTEQVGTFKVKLCSSQAAMDWKSCAFFSCCSCSSSCVFFIFILISFFCFWQFPRAILEAKRTKTRRYKTQKNGKTNEKGSRKSSFWQFSGLIPEVKGWKITKRNKKMKKVN